MPLYTGEKFSLDEIKALKKEKANMAKDIKEKEALISKLQFEIEETAKQIEFNTPKEFDEKVLGALEHKPSEEEIKLLMKQVDELKNKPTTIIDIGATNLYRAELAAKVAHENLLKAQAEFLQNFVQYEELLNATPMDTDRSILDNMASDYKKLQ